MLRRIFLQVTHHSTAFHSLAALQWIWLVVNFGLGGSGGHCVIYFLRGKCQGASALFYFWVGDLFFIVVGTQLFLAFGVAKYATGFLMG